MAGERVFPYPVYWDMDGVLVRKHHPANIPGRVTKAFPRRMPYVVNTLGEFFGDPDFVNVSVATSRGEFLRGRQTPRQLRSRRHAYPFSYIAKDDPLYSAHDYAEKVRQVLLDGAAQFEDGFPVRNDEHVITVKEGVRRVVLVDDSTSKMVKAILEVSEQVEFGDLLSSFAFVLFGATDHSFGKIQGILDKENSRGTRQLGDVQGSIDPVLGMHTLWLPTHGPRVPIVAMREHGAAHARAVMTALKRLP